MSLVYWTSTSIDTGILNVYYSSDCSLNPTIYYVDSLGILHVKPRNTRWGGFETLPSFGHLDSAEPTLKPAPNGSVYLFQGGIQ